MAVDTLHLLFRFGNMVRKYVFILGNMDRKYGSLPWYSEK